MEERKEVLTAPEVAELLQISLWSVYDMSRRGVIPYFSIGRCKRFLREEIMDWASGQAPKIERVYRL